MKSWDEKLEDIDRHLADDTLSNGEYVILSTLRDVMEELAGIGSTVLVMPRVLPLPRSLIRWDHSSMRNTTWIWSCERRTSG